MGLGSCSAAKAWARPPLSTHPMSTRKHCSWSPGQPAVCCSKLGSGESGDPVRGGGDVEVDRDVGGDGAGGGDGVGDEASGVSLLKKNFYFIHLFLAVSSLGCGTWALRCCVQAPV